MKWLKSAAVGAVGSLVMFAAMMVGINVTGIAPFNVPPSAAFLEQLGLNVGPLALLVHFGYGAFWSMVLVAWAGRDTSVGKGLTLAGGLWLFMMVVYSPIIGWGFFGFGDASSLAADAPLYLEPGPKYAVMTLLLHVVFGLIIGWLNPAWLSDDELAGSPVSGADESASRVAA